MLKKSSVDFGRRQKSHLCLLIRKSVPGLRRRHHLDCVARKAGKKNSTRSNAVPRPLRAAERITQEAVVVSREGPVTQLVAETDQPRLGRMKKGRQDPQRLLDLSLKDGELRAEGDFALLRDVGREFTARNDSSLPSALVLGLSAPESVSTIDRTLGLLTCNRFLACARIKLWWMTPEWGSKASELPPETQFMLVQLSRNGPYAVILPLIDGGSFRSTLRPPRKGQEPDTALRLRVESGHDAVVSSQWDSTVLVAAGYDPFYLVDVAVAAAAGISGNSKARVDKVPPEMLDYFGWCTWDAFYSTISAEGIQQGLKSLKEGGVPPSFLIIDDGWQQTAADSDGSKPNTARLEAKKEMLKTVGAGGHYPTNKLQSEEGEGSAKAVSMLTQLADNAVGRVQALAETALLVFYKLVVESAPEGSWRIAFFSALAQGPLKPALLSYFALTSDHTQRLQGVRANGKFSSLEATPETPMSRPDNLATIVRNAKEEYGCKFVYAWHSLHGYWAGVATGKDLPYNAQLVMPKPTPGVLEIDPCFAWQQQVMAGVGVAPDVKALYKDMHTYLAGAGLDGVKVDCQAILGMVGGGTPGQGGGPAMSARYHAAMEESVAHHFPGNNCINCMCHSTEDLYRMENTTVARSSDDFWPQDPASHTTHVAVNAYNSLFMGALVQPDWDMFHSRHPAALLHATARVISGGPVYVSDKPGQHDFGLLKRMVLADGSLLRCTQVGRPTLDTLFDDVMRDGTSLLKVWNTNSCNALVASFNLQGASWSRQLRKYVTHDLQPASLSIGVSPQDIPAYKELPPQTRFAVYSDDRKQLWAVSSHQGVRSQLQPGRSDLFTVVPIHEATGGVEFAPVGLTNMLNTGGAVCDWAPASGDPKFTFKVRGRGELLAYCSQEPQACTVNGKPIEFTYTQQGQLTLPIPYDASQVVVQV